MELTLLERRREAGDAISFVFERPPTLTWRPGQWLRVEIPHPDSDERGLRRYFTIASAPHENVVQLTTRLFPVGSTFKQALLALQPGDVAVVDGAPGGAFTDPAPGDAHVFVAGGIGVTPFRSILVDLDRRGSGPQITLVYGTRRDVVFAGELDAIAARNPWLTIRYVVGPAFVDAPLLRSTLAGDEQVWISGPELMVHALHALVAAVGVPHDRIRRDEFPGYDGVSAGGTRPRARPSAAARG